MNLSKMLLSMILLTITLYSANINVTTKYGKTGGIVGKLNETDDKINGREICTSDPTNGCDFSDDPKFENNGTTEDPSDDSYSGDLLVRTNDNFEAIAGWTWNGNAGGVEEVVTITGTLPLKDDNAYYEWAFLPGSCNPNNSNITNDKQTIVCERKDFDKNDVGTYSEDLIFNVRVRGGTPNGMQPGDIKFKVEAPEATAKEDTTDNNSLTVTASPRWNLQKSIYTAWAGKEYDIDGDGTKEKGWILDYKFYIESDEVNGETDNVNPIVGNESMGKDRTFEFTDDMSGLPPHAKIIGCNMTGRWDRKDGYDGSADPLTYYGDGSIYGSKYPERHILATKDEQKITCTQNGNKATIKVEHIDATLDHYPTKDYVGRDLPKNRAIAAIGNIQVFIPLDDVKKGKDDEEGTDDDGQYATLNKLTYFDPKTPSGNSNFGDNTESEKDNSYRRTLYYARGDWSKRFRGGGSTNYNGNDHLDYIYGWLGTGDRSGDGMVTKNAEFSTWLVTNNSGGTSFSEDTICDVIDAYRLKIQPIKDNVKYKNIGNRYTGNGDLPYRYYIGGDDGNYTDGVTHGGNNEGGPEIPYVVEYATDYVDDSFLPSKNGDTTVVHSDDIKKECTDSSVKWTTDLNKAMQDSIGITKVRFRLKSGIEHTPGSTLYIWINHKVRDTDLATNQPMQNGDLIVNYAAHKFSYQDNWSLPSYIPGVFPDNHTNWNGDRVIYTGPKVRIKKSESRDSAEPSDEVIYSLKMSYTDDIGTEGNVGDVKVVDILPKDFTYQQGSTKPSDEFDEPTMGTCTDADDINSSTSPCKDGENQVLIWDLGNRPINGNGIPDLNYTVVIGAAANVGVSTNVVKIESSTDASLISQRKADIGLNISIPSSITIVKTTEENPDYKSPRERTTDQKDIFFKMDMRNGKDGNITDVDAIDILPFVGDGEKVIKFNDILVKRKIPTQYHGEMKFHNADFTQHPKSETTCDYQGKIKYYYTNEDPKKINIAPTVSDENKIDNDKSIWCEGDKDGPNGCTITSKNFTFTDNSQVTAVRVRGATMEKQAICQFKVHLSVKDNLAGDNYSNSTGASATGVTLPVLSNSLAVPIVGSSLGDYVWYDRDANGIQDDNEKGMAGVTVKLLDDSGNPVKNPINSSEDYVVKTDSEGKYLFSKINSGKYIVEFVKPNGYIASEKSLGENSALDSDINKNNSKTDTITLDVDSKDLTIDAGFYTPIISGHIFDDGNNDKTVNGTDISSLDGTPLYVTLLDENNNTLASKAVSAKGTYSFDGDDNLTANKNYIVVLSISPNKPSSILPVGWNSADGEHIGTDVGLDSKADGSIVVSVDQADVPNVNFGINKKPEVSDVTKTVEFNPSGTTQVNVPDLNISDKEDGTPTTVTIKTLPSNGKLYYGGKAVKAGQVITDFDNDKLTVDPNSGEVIVKFDYTTTDKAGVESDSATVTMPFKDLKISGHLFIDGNGDGNINGTATSTADEVKLYITLVKDGTALASKPLSGGAYMFDIENGVKANSKFSVVLSDINGTTTASLPKKWSNEDGEKVGLKGTDGSNDGNLVVSVKTTDIINANFGINKKPEANDVTEPEQVNPGTSSSVQVPDLNISDSQSSSLDVNFTSIPNNATLDYNGTTVQAGDIIKNFDNTLLTIDPKSGEQNISFDYSVRDEAGVVSDIATVSMSFKNIIISGKLFNDGNGNGNVDGNATAKAENKQLYVTLVDSTNKAISSKALDSNGTYYFDSVDGLSPDTNYTIVLTDTQNSKDATLPINWNNADGENIGLIGLDGKADGIITVEVLRSDIKEINFGINRQPEAEDKTEVSQINPGGTTQVVVPDLNITDREDGKPTILTITKLPTNGILYYNGIEVNASQVISNVKIDKFTFDPNDGDLTAVFKYTTTDRAGVVSKPATVTLPFTALQILGNIFNDGDNDGKVNGTGISAPSGTQLYVTLLDANGTALASKEVNGDGSYIFGNTYSIVADTNYSVILTTKLNDTNAFLPIGWSNLDGEHIGTDKGTDGSNDGRIDVSVATQNVVEVNFGINKKPVAGDRTAPLQLNPGGNIRVNVPDLLILDNEDGNLTTVTIETLPNHGTLYYNGVKVVAGQEIHDLNNSLLTLDPNNGDQTVSFTYSTIDAVGDKSDIATVSMSFKGLEIKGNIFNDGNHNGKVDGTKISKIDTKQLYVTLLNNSGTVMATTAINSDGTYKFNGIDGIAPDSNYTVVLSNEANATTPTLPTNWNNADGENIGLIGLDGKADGIVDVEVLKSDVKEINFGINEQPIAIDKVENLRLNPSSNTQVSVPTLEITDREDIKPTTIVITTLPTNGVLYYNGTKVEKDVNISNVDVSKFTVDPDNGDINVTFEYVSVDKTGWHSKPATVEMPFYGLKISGKVFLDTNGDNRVDGMPFSSDSYGLQVYANLVDSNGTVVKTVAVDSSGEYLFDVTTGVIPNSDYKVVLSSEQNTTVATLPTNWEHTDHNTNGVIEVHVAISDIENINFGLNKQPVVHNVIAQEIVNPDGNRTVDVPNLEIDPNEDGNTTVTIVTLSNLPNNATLYYNGVIVTDGQTINDFNNSLLVIDPNEYNLTVEFTYTVEDSAGFESESATVTMPFADSDTDGDGITNSQDLDDDNDGILDTVENNTSLNGGDSDGDGIPDRLDLDSDGDGILDLEESNPNAETVDSNGDGTLDSTTDIDRDGVMDTADRDDNNPLSEGSVIPVDTDSDGQPDFQDVDSDNDGLSDVVEGGTDATQDSNSDGILDDLTDTDGDGIADVVDIDNNGTTATTPDTDKDGVDNYRDLDSDGDALFDVIEINGVDSNNDGEIEPVGTLVDGTNLPDENNNGIPNVLEMKLKDDIKTVPVGTIATINLLENDSGDIAPDSVKLIIPMDFKGIARLSPDGKTMVVDGEGEWSVDNHGIVTFKPEVGFKKNPTPIKYKASTRDGSKTSIATIILKVTVVAGVSVDDACLDYSNNSASVPTVGIYGLILMVLFGSIFGASLVRREE